MPVELFREVQIRKETGPSTLERVALFAAICGFSIGLVLLSLAWSWM